jgi:asparagine synthase (glutamine-hydrolysing)
VEKIARAHIGSVDRSLVDENIRMDKGSLYRYGNDSYGQDAPRFYLQQIEEGIKRKYIPGFLAT